MLENIYFKLGHSESIPAFTHLANFVELYEHESLVCNFFGHTRGMLLFIINKNDLAFERVLFETPQPILECMKYLREFRKAVNMEIFDTWMREYQVCSC
jgi:hypothetical protein